MHLLYVHLLSVSAWPEENHTSIHADFIAEFFIGNITPGSLSLSTLCFHLQVRAHESLFIQ